MCNVDEGLYDASLTKNFEVIAEKVILYIPNAKKHTIYSYNS